MAIQITLQVAFSCYEPCKVMFWGGFSLMKIRVTHNIAVFCSWVRNLLA